MEVEIKNTVVPIGEIQKTFKIFAKTLKKKYPKCLILSFAREVSSTHADVISIPVSESMTPKEFEEINQKISELIHMGFQPASDSSVNINVSTKKLEFKQTVKFPEFGK